MVVWLATLISATSRFALQVHWYVSWHHLCSSLFPVACLDCLQRILDSSCSCCQWCRRNQRGLSCIPSCFKDAFIFVSSSSFTAICISLTELRFNALSGLGYWVPEASGVIKVEMLVIWAAIQIYNLLCFCWLQSLVSLIFSFMLVWDMPAIRRGVQSLKQSRLSIVYEEIAPVVNFILLFTKCFSSFPL